RRTQDACPRAGRSLRRLRRRGLRPGGGRDACVLQVAPGLGRARLVPGNEKGLPMKLSDEDRDRLALHTAFAVHQISRWIATRDDVPKDIRDRLRGHITALEGVMVSSGHDWIRDEMDATEAAL